MPNAFDDLVIGQNSFAYRDLIGQDRWEPFDPVFGSLTVVGATNYLGRRRIVGKMCQLQVKFSAATLIASAAGTDYLNLPLPAMGLAGFGAMTDDTGNVAVGLCHLDVATSRLYLPAQAASGNTFNIYAEHEV